MTISFFITHSKSNTKVVLTSKEIKVGLLGYQAELVDFKDTQVQTPYEFQALF